MAPRAILIQSAGEPAHHGILNFDKVTYAQEMIEYNFYLYECWDESQHGPTKNLDKELGNITEGDYIIQYCKSNVSGCRSRICHLFRVVQISSMDDKILDWAEEEMGWDHEIIEKMRGKPVTLWLERIHSLLQPITYKEIHENLVPNGVLSPRMAYCGWQGFNLCEVEWSDFLFAKNR